MATTAFKRKKTNLLKKALWQSGLVLIGVTAWVALFKINDDLAFSEAWKSMISIQGLFVAFLAVVTGIISNLVIGQKITDEVIIIFILVLVAGLIEAWGMRLEPVFLPALIIIVYLETKIWINYIQEKKFLKRTNR